MARRGSRGGRGGGGGGGFGGGGGGSRGIHGGRGSSSPLSRHDRPQAPKPRIPRLPGSLGQDEGMGLGNVIAGTFIGSALGSVLGNAISRKMYEGRDHDTGEWMDCSKPDDNPCKRELETFLDCYRLSIDPETCKIAGIALKKCAEGHKGEEVEKSEAYIYKEMPGGI